MPDHFDASEKQSPRRRLRQFLRTDRESGLGNKKRRAGQFAAQPSRSGQAGDDAWNDTFIEELCATTALERSAYHLEAKPIARDKATENNPTENPI